MPPERSKYRSHPSCSFFDNNQESQQVNEAEQQRVFDFEVQEGVRLRFALQQAEAKMVIEQCQLQEKDNIEPIHKVEHSSSLRNMGADVVLFQQHAELIHIPPISTNTSRDAVAIRILQNFKLAGFKFTLPAIVTSAMQSTEAEQIRSRQAGSIDRQDTCKQQEENLDLVIRIEVAQYLCSLCDKTALLALEVEVGQPEQALLWCMFHSDHLGELPTAFQTIIDTDVIAGSLIKDLEEDPLPDGQTREGLELSLSSQTNRRAQDLLATQTVEAMEGFMDRYKGIYGTLM
ncbi:hypothetical protein FRB93_010148 [Tulasnella sp. JGI-2019a]|nr:hypothetical protein FRB93_010148 [Tulasnella sp. JGI-2019a]